MKFACSFLAMLALANAYTPATNNRRAFISKAVSIAVAVPVVANAADINAAARNVLDAASTEVSPQAAAAVDAVKEAVSNASNTINAGGTNVADYTTTESGLRYKIIREGTGAVPEPGQSVKTQYTGWLDNFESDKMFDSSRQRGRPFTFKVGKGQVIRGWDEAFGSMKVGERRLIIIPPRLGYGDRGAGGIIPGGATLYFDVELLGIV